MNELKQEQKLELILADGETITKEYIINAMKSMTAAFKYLTKEEGQHFIIACTLLQLNPIKNEIFVVKFGKTFNIMVASKVYAQRAAKTGLIDWHDTKIHDRDENGKLLDKMNWSGTFSIKRRDSSKVMKFTIWFNEWKQTSHMWETKPRLMFNKCIEANGYRKSFPLDINLPYVEVEGWGNDVNNEKMIIKAIEPSVEEKILLEKVPADYIKKISGGI